MEIGEIELSLMLGAAIDARDRAYAPYSNFRVGAAVLSAEGKVYTGANIENSSLGLTICAERVAIGAALMESVRKIEALLVVGGDEIDPDESKRITPCGACLQVISEFMPGDGTLIFASLDFGTEVHSLKDIFPRSFKLKEKLT